MTSDDAELPDGADGAGAPPLIFALGEFSTTMVEILSPCRMRVLSFDYPVETGLTAGRDRPGA